MNRLLTIFVFAGCFALYAQDADPEPINEPKILVGYGQSTWGQGSAELIAEIPDLEIVNEKRGYSTYLGPGKGKITEIVYFFLHDQLFKIVLTMDLREDKTAQSDPVGLKLIRQTLFQKYDSDPAIQELLAAAEIMISVSEAANATAQVTYYNGSIRNKVEKAAAETKAEKEAEALAERVETQQELKALADDDEL